MIERLDIIVISIVSCIYYLDLPESWRDLHITVEKGKVYDIEKFKKDLASHLQYERNDMVLQRARFRVKGDVMEIFHTYMEQAYRIELLKGLKIGEFDVLIGINLLREGIDLPEVSFIAILDADKIVFYVLALA